MVEIMRLVLMFDVPTLTAKERKDAAAFRTFIVGEGFVMSQFSVYVKQCLGVSGAEAALERLRGSLPKAGRCTVFMMTEKEYARRYELLAPVDLAVQESLGEQLTLSL